MPNTPPFPAPATEPEPPPRSEARSAPRTAPRALPAPGWTPPALSAPGWLAAAGASMLLIASIIVVAGRWEAISPIVRFSGLVGSLFAVAFTAEAARERIRSTATALAVLAACLTAPVMIAAAAALEASWPVCVALGGGAALVAAEMQSRRWKVGSLKAATAVAAGLVASGVAAITSVPVGVLGAAAAIGALLLGARRRSVALAIVVPFIPLLDALAEAGVGPGTLARIGAIGSDPWVVPASSFVAALVIGITAHRRNSAPLAATSLAVGLWGGLFGLTDASPGVALWLSVPAAFVVIIEAAATMSGRSIFGRWADRARLAVTSPLAAAGVMLPTVAIFGDVISTERGDGPLTHFMLPAAATLCALAFAAVLSVRRPLDNDPAASADFQDLRGHATDLVRVGAIGAAIAVAVVGDVDLIWVSVVALAAWLMTTGVTRWHNWVAVSAAHAGWATGAAFGAIDADPGPVVAVILASAAIMLIACSWTTSTAANFAGVPLTVVTAAALVASQLPDELAGLALAFGLMAVTSTGIAMLSSRLGPLDALAGAAGATALALAVGTTPAGVSLAVLLVSAQAWLYAASRRENGVAVAAAGFGFSAVVSLWWTTGTHQLVIDQLAPYGIDGQDLALAAASLALIAGGVVLRSTVRPSTWLAYGPGLGIAMSWLLMSQRDVDANWATMAALGIGVLALTAGGVRRLAAPLVLGSGTLVGTLLVSAGPRLAEAPTWIWIALGGVALLAVAALVERSDRPLLPTQGPGDVSSVLEDFCREFE